MASSNRLTSPSKISGAGTPRVDSLNLFCATSSAMLAPEREEHGMPSSEVTKVANA